MKKKNVLNIWDFHIVEMGFFSNVIFSILFVI